MNFCRFLNPTISIIMCGHLSKTELDGASLANVLINVLGVSVELGFSTSFDTLFAQVYGSKCKRKLGLMLQKGILVMTVMYLLLASFNLNIEPILILFKQDVEISRLTARYVTLYLPGLFFDFLFMVISRYLQTQNIVYPTMLSSFLSCVFNAFVQYIVIYVLHYGIEGSAVIQAMACLLAFTTQLLYIWFSGIYHDTWQGIEFYNALKEWGIFFRFGIPGIIMIGITEWSYEIGNFVAGALDDVQLGSQTITFQTGLSIFLINIGLSIAGSIRCGQYLGANQPKKALLSIYAIMIANLIISIIAATFTLSLKHYIPLIYSNDEEIQLLAEKLLMIIAVFQICDAGNSSNSAVFRACGRQMQAAVVSFFCYYVIGIPLAFIFIIVLKMDIRGFWWGILVAYSIQIIIYFIIVYHINWNDEAKKALERIEESDLTEMLLDDVSKSSDETEDIKNKKSFATESSKEQAFDSFEMNSDKKNVIVANNEVTSSIQRKTFDKNILLKRGLLCGFAFGLFISSILLKIILPREYYIPCVNNINNDTRSLIEKHYPLCTNFSK